MSKQSGIPTRRSFLRKSFSDGNKNGFTRSQSMSHSPERTNGSISTATTTTVTHRPTKMKPRPRSLCSPLDRSNSFKKHGNFGACFQKLDKLQSLPSAVVKQARLTGHLNLSNKALIEVPDIVWNLNSLTNDPSTDKGKLMTASFDFPLNEDDSPERWWDYVDLTKLLLASNKLSSIPGDIENLVSLTVLDLHDNQITALPESLGELKCLNKLDLSRNRLKELPECIFKLTDLKTLLLGYNLLTDINDDIGNLSCIEELNVANNSLTTLPNTIGFLSRTKCFNLSNNQIQFLPTEICSMTGLRTLDLTSNCLTEIPEDLGLCPYLEQLYLRHNRLENLPEHHELSSLKELHLGNNRLSTITPRFCECITNVRVLDIRDNKLVDIPEEIVNIRHLERLDLTNNSLVNLPYTISSLPHLKSLLLEGNTLRAIRRDILQRGTVQLLKWLKSRIEDDSPSSKRLDMNGAEVPTEEQLIKAFDKHSLRNARALEIINRGIQNLPQKLVDLSVEVEITVVDLSKNAFTDIPETLDTLMPQITELKMTFNRMDQLRPESLNLASRLIFLDIRNNQLEDLPMELATAQDLRELNIAYNKFKTLPKVLYNLLKLEILFAHNNNITVLDIECLSDLRNLATLDLTNNDIMTVPPELGNLKQLRSLQLEGNKFRCPRPAVLAKGTQHILEYLRDRIPR